MNQQKNSILITHVDMDGSGADIVCKYYDKNHRKTFFVNYDRIDKVTEEVVHDKRWSTIYIVDISPSEEVVHKLDSRVVIIDHHRTTRFLNDLGHIWDSSHCGCKLFYRYMSKKFRERNGYLKFLTDTIDVCDRFVYDSNDDLREEAYNMDALHIAFGQTQYIRMFQDKRPIYSENANPKSILYSYERVTAEALRTRSKETWDRYVKKCEVFTDEMGRKYTIIFRDEPSSNLFNYILQMKKLDYIISVNTLSGGVSLCSVGNTNVSKLAKKLGGGGHTRASGMPIKDLKNLLLDVRKNLGLNITDKMNF